MDKTNILIIILAVSILIGSIFLTLYYFINQKNECLNNPLVFGANQITHETGFEFVGRGFLIVPVNYKSPSYSFNSTNISIEN